MSKRQSIAITEVSDDITSRHEDDSRLVIRHALVLETRLGGRKPIRIPVAYFEKVEDGRECADYVTRISRAKVPLSLRPVVRKAVMRHLERRFDISGKAWPSEPIRFNPKDVIMVIHGDPWKFSPADAARFLQACIGYEATGRDEDKPGAADYGGLFIEGASVLSLNYDDDWSVENLQDLIRGLEG